MKRVFQLALVGVIAAMVVGCGKGDDDDDDNTVLVAPAEKDGGGVPNFACVGTADPFTGGVGTVDLDVTIATPLATGGEQPVQGATAVQIDPDDLSDVGSVSAASDAAGLTTLTIDGNARTAIRIDGPSSDFITTYYFNQITPAANGSDDLLLISQTVYGAFIGLLGFQPADLAGTGQVSGAITDCDGDTIRNAIIEVSGATPVFIGYFNEGGTPDKNATFSAGNGQFLLVGVPPTSATFHVVAKVYDGTEAEGVANLEVSEADVQAQADEITIGIVSPIFN